MEELKALFEELEGIYRTVFVGGVVGLRVSEVIGLRWSGDGAARNCVPQIGQWKEFLTQHWELMVAAEFFTVKYGLVVGCSAFWCCSLSSCQPDG